MAKGVTFGSIHTNTNLNLILQEEEIEPAAPKTNFVDIPGADGSKDLTEALGAGVKFEDGAATWVFALYPADDWATKRKQVSAAINGLRCNIVLDSDPNYVYSGRVSVENYKADKMLRQITVKARMAPYKLEPTNRSVSRDDLTGSYKTLTLASGRMPVIPTITVQQATTLLFAGSTFAITAGTHGLTGIVLSEGNNTLKAKLTDPETAEHTNISVSYKVGELY